VLTDVSADRIVEIVESTVDPVRREAHAGA